MKGATGALLVVVGLLVLYLAVAGRLKRVPDALRQVWDGTALPSASAGNGGGSPGTPEGPVDPNSLEAWRRRMLGQPVGPSGPTSMTLPMLPPLPALANPIYG